MRAWIHLLGLPLGCAGVLAQGAPAVVEPVPAAVIQQRREFNHDRPEHRKQDCALCHQRRSNDPTPEFPYHPACLACHSADFTSPASQLCVTCHPMPMGEPPRIANFPQRMNQFGIARFSHRDHQDPGKMPAGTTVAGCPTCHRFGARGLEAGYPGHVECYGCHPHQAGEKLGGCRNCHAVKALALAGSRGPAAAYRLYRFTHGSHFKHQNLQQDCGRCHRLAPEPAAGSVSDIQRIDTSRGQRHESAGWTCHAQAKEPVCTRCHAGAIPW